MKIRLGFTTSFIALLVAIAVLSHVGSYWVTRNLLGEIVTEREIDKMRTVGVVIESRLAHEAGEVAQLATLLSRTGTVIEGLPQLGKPGAPAVTNRLNDIHNSAKFDIFELANPSEMIVYRGQSPVLTGDRAAYWGVSEALAGRRNTVSNAEPRGVSVRALEPVRAGTQIIGAVIVGFTIDDKFMATLSQQMGARLTLLSRESLIAASHGQWTTPADAAGVREAFQQKIPIYRHDPETRTSRAYLPVLIVDDGYVVVAEFDSAPAYVRLAQSARQTVILSAILLTLSVLVGFALLQLILRPLRRLTSRTLRELPEAAAAIEKSDRHTDAVGTVVQTLDKLTNHLVSRNRELGEAKLAAEAASVSKSQFLSHMSHEIRTPLNGVLGMADLMAQTPLNEQQQEYLRAIAASGRTLNALLSDVLDLAKIEAGKIELEQIDFTLSRMIDDISDAYRSLAAEKGLALLTKIDPALPRRISGDPTRLRQILSNLVGNALKFTHKGSISLAFERIYDNELSALPGVHSGIRCVVRDSGIGMAPATIEKLFQPFKQGDEKTTRRYGGSGLGLVICKDLVTLMGGDIQIASEPGKGTTVSIILPLKVAADAAQENSAVQTAPSAPLPAQFPVSVLVAEDEPINRLVIRRMLMHVGASVTIAEDGQQAVDMLSQHGFDIVFMDCQMPLLDGFEATARIRSQESPNKRVPIIALTANALAGDRQRCLEAGMDDYLTKPVNIARLVEVLERWTAPDHPETTPAALTGTERT